MVLNKPELMPDNTRLEVRQCDNKYYAILRHEDETLGVTGRFTSHTAAYLAGQTMLDRYKRNMQASLDF